MNNDFKKNCQMIIAWFSESFQICGNIQFQIFLENNGRVDVFDHEGRSALHLAAEHGSIDVCEALLNKNAFINSKAKTGWTSLHYAAMKGYTSLVEYLIKKHNATIDSLTMVRFNRIPAPCSNDILLQYRLSRFFWMS